MGCLPLKAFANAAPVCIDIKSEQIRLSIAASNLANLNSTRTPEGGAYRPFKITSCENGSCKIERTDNPIMKYLPDHPDADKNGYVAYPNIDEKSEYATFNMTATKLKLLASEKACGVTTLTDNGNSSIALRYNAKSETQFKEDIFNFNTSRQVVSWMRQDTKGRATSINFDANGRVVSHSQSE